MNFIQPKNGLIFRLIHIDNLSFILQHGLSCKNCEPQHPNYMTIGADDIIEKRDNKPIHIAPFGVLSDYIPFYFAPRSPMLYRIFKSDIHLQNALIYLVSRANIITKLNLPYIFTDGHPIVAYTQYFNKIKQLSEIDWKILRSTYWTNTKEDNDCKRRRMAEFLIHQHVPINAIKLIGVQNESMRQKVQKQLKKFNFASAIQLKQYPTWYFK